ncbi:MAG: MotA/TolQ/ExbB proton channel family protein [Oscillospiraceae bacterium]|nr:MotA/TolQ/ExbB proton channel family protein [Oscillospiraceae bacterium]
MSVPVIFSNIIGYDGLIFIAAAANAVIFQGARNAAVRLYSSMHKEVYTPSCGSDIKSIRSDIGRLTDKKVSALRERAVAWYTLYVNITGIFPLLGILGTVISLLGMVGNTSDVEGSFFAALTSTFWGLVFAMIFKFLDGFVSPKLDDGERAAELFMQRKAENHPSADLDDVRGLFENSEKDSPELPDDKKTEPKT